MRLRHVVFLVGMLLVCFDLAWAQVQFRAPYRHYPTGAQVAYLAVGRIDGDTHPDIAVTHPDEGDVQILAGTASGGFVAHPVMSVSHHPAGIAIADIDQDSVPDLVVGGADPNGIIVLHGNGDGTFTAQPLITTPHLVDGLAVADFNADGAPDVIACSIEGSEILLNDGTGSFLPPQSHPFSAYGLPFGIGRIDADAYPDLVFGTGGGIIVLPGLGDGTFGPTEYFAGGCSVHGVIVADLDGDDDLDAIGIDGCSDASSPSAIIRFANNGGGTMSAIGTFYASGDPAVVVAGDLDGDTHPDLGCVVSDDSYGPVLDFMIAEGGGFLRLWSHDTHTYRQIVTVDVDGDGADEALQADEEGVSVFAGSPTRAFATPRMATAEKPLEMLATQIDDGPTLDLAILRDPDYDAITFELGTGNGSFLGLLEAGFGEAEYFDIAKLDGDGHPDLVTASAAMTQVYPGSGDGNFQHPGIAFAFGGPVRVARLDGDTSLDLLTARWDSLASWHNRGDGTFERLHTWSPGGNLMRVGDLDGDGFADLVMRRGTGSSMSAGTQVVIRRSLGDGDLGSESMIEVSVPITDLRLADLDGDDDLDVLIARGSNVPACWLSGRGDATFDPLQTLDCTPGTRIAYGDFNGDGLLDAASLHGHLAIGLGHGDGHFDAPTWYGTGRNPRDLLEGDFDDDGRVDLAVLNGGAYEYYVGVVDLMFNHTPFTTTVASPRHSVAGRLQLGAPTPNPSRGSAFVRLSRGDGARLDARIVDILGREVRVLHRGTAPAGLTGVHWDGRDARGARAAPGIYFLNVRTESETATRRVVLLN